MTRNSDRVASRNKTWYSPISVSANKKWMDVVRRPFCCEVMVGVCRIGFPSFNHNTSGSGYAVVSSRRWVMFHVTVYSNPTSGDT